MIIREQLQGMPNELWMAAERALVTDVNDRRNALVGCVIQRSDGVLVSARNGSTHGVKGLAHAEARASRKANVNSVAYVSRVRRDGSIGCARPCKTCRAKLRARGIRDVMFTVSANSWGRMRLCDEAEHIWTNTRTT